MIRASLIALALLATPAAASETIVLKPRDGGYTHQHIAQAKRWLADGKRLVINGEQLSAAAIQAVYYKRHGGRICAARGASLHFHLSTLRGGRGQANTLAVWIGRANAARIGHLKPGQWKRFSPATFGIGACK
jgi:hypothetical protein